MSEAPRREVSTPLGHADLDEPLALALDRAAARFGDRTFLTSRSVTGEDLTFADIAERGRALGRGLGRLGVAAGDRVAILAENRPRWCTAFAGAVHAGAVAVTLDAELSAEGVADVLAHAGARVVLATSETAPSLEAARQAGHLDVVVGLDPGAGDVDWEDALEVEGALPTPRGGDTPAVILYTSGTTGAPKGVVLTHRNLAAERAAVDAVLRIDERDVLLMFLPMHHLLSQLGAFLLPYEFGARVVHVQVASAPDLVDAMAEGGVTILLAVPLLYHRLHQGLLERLGASLPGRALFGLCRLLSGPTGGRAGRLLLPVHRAFGGRLRLCLSGASALDPGAQRDLTAAGLPLLQAYGLTECAGGATFTRPGRVIPGSVGPPLPGVAVAIDAPDADGTGEVLLRGPNLMAGYWNDPAATAAAIEDGWLHTGDLGRLGADGELRISGRAKEVIVLESGKNVNPEDVETHYAREPAIDELCVLPASDDARGSHGLHAVIVPDWERLAAEGTTSVRERVRSDLMHAGPALPAYARVQSFELRRAPLPRTATRKLQRFRVHAERTDSDLSERPARDSSAAAARLASPAGQALARLAAARAPAGAEIRAQAHLELDLGLDSLRRTELLVEAQSALGLELSDEELGGIQTLDDLLQLADASRATGSASPAPSEEGAGWVGIISRAGSGDLPPWLRAPRGPLSSAALATTVGLLRLAGRLYLRLEVRGREHFPREGAFLVCPNHVSFLDSVLVPATIPLSALRRGFVIGHAMYLSSPLGRMLARFAGAVPTDADAQRDSSFRACAAGLKQGRPLVIFPEGTRSVDGALNELRLGAPILASELGLPIVPARMVGAFESWPRGRLLPLPRKVRIVYGPPLDPASYAREGSPAARHRAVCEQLRAALLALGCPPGPDDVAAPSAMP